MRQRFLDVKTAPDPLKPLRNQKALVTGANFKDITVRASVKILRYPSPEEFILRHITGSPLGSAPSPGADDQICSGRSP